MYSSPECRMHGAGPELRSRGPEDEVDAAVADDGPRQLPHLEGEGREGVV